MPCAEAGSTTPIVRCWFNRGVASGLVTAADMDVTTTLNVPSGTILPATCTASEIFLDTDSDDCADTGGGSGSACVCTAANTWTQITGGGSSSYGDDTALEFGDDIDYWLIYNSTATQLELWTTDVGGGTDNALIAIDDGDGYIDLQTNAKLNLAGTVMYFDADNDGDTWLQSGSADSVTLKLGNYALDFVESGNLLYLRGRINLGYDAKAEVCADSGDGNPGAKTITPNSGYMELTINDADGCDLTLAEGGSAEEGVHVTIVNLSTNTGTLTDSAGVSEMAGNFTMGQYDSIQFVYDGSTWIEVSRSNN